MGFQNNPLSNICLLLPLLHFEINRRLSDLVVALKDLTRIFEPRDLGEDRFIKEDNEFLMF